MNSLHTDVGQSPLPQLRPDPGDLVQVWGDHSYLISRPPPVRPVPLELGQSVHHLVHLAVVVEGGAVRVLVILAPGSEEGERMPGEVGGLLATGHQLLLVEHVTGEAHYGLVTPVVL